MNSQLGCNHCKMQMFEVLFSSIFWSLMMWLISILKQNLHVKSLCIQWGHANRFCPNISAVRSKTCISCLGSKQNQNRRVFIACKVAENCFSKPLRIFLGVLYTLWGEIYSCNSGQCCNWDWFSLYFSHVKRNPDVSPVFWLLSILLL